MQRIRELDGLRAIAILLVLGCHYQGFASLLHGLPQFGWFGVDIFFVLSGYLITTILLGLRDQPKPYKTFYARRSIRIFPPYFAALVPVFVLAFVFRQTFVLTLRFVLTQLLLLRALTDPPGEYLVLCMHHPFQFVTHLPNILAYAHHLPVGSNGLVPTLDAPSFTYWSLSIEEYFYLLWAPVVLHFSRHKIVAIGVVVCAIEMFLRWNYGDQLSYFSFFFRVDTLLYGAFLALIFERWRKTGRPRFAFRTFIAVIFSTLGPLGCILFAIRPIIGFEIRQSPLFMVMGIPLLSLAVACTIGCLIIRSGSNWWPARFLRTRAMQTIGTVSYTMYLVHILSALAVRHVASRIFPARSFLVVEALLSSVLTFVVARVSWHYLEKPLLRWKDSRFSAVKTSEPNLN